MTPDQRFAVLLVILGAMFPAIGYLVKIGLRLSAAAIKREQLVDDQIAALDRHDKANAEQTRVLALALADQTGELTKLYIGMAQDISLIKGSLSTAR